MDAARHPAAHPPPGPFRPRAWRSPLRGLWLTSVLAVVLLAGLTILAVTGLLSYAAYDPLLPGNDQTPGAGLLRFYMFSWPTHPSWLYRVDQGVHITLGLALLPVVLAKLWSVLPRLFAWPPVRSLAQILERVSLIMLVGGVLFEFATGILNIQNYYVFPFSFYTAHLYGAWVFIAGFVIHVALKFPRMVTGLRSRSLRRELRTPLAETTPEEPDPADDGTPGLRAARPRAPTISRRGLLAAVGGASVTLAGLVVGQSIGGLARRTALFGPRGLSATAPHYLPVNRTATSIGLTAADVGPAYRLTLVGARTVTLTRNQILALPQHAVELPIACVEGWSVSAHWTGVRLADLARLAGMPAPGRGAGRLDPAGRGVQVRGPVRGPGDRSAVAAGRHAQRPRAALGSRLPGPDDHPERTGRAQHQMGQQDHFPEAGVTGVTTRGRTLTSRIRHWYGANPLHLLALLAAFALAGYAVRAVIAAGQFRGFAIWFAVAIIGHDLLLFPLYSLADLSVQRLLPWRGRGNQAQQAPPGQVPGPPLINYVRIPVAFSLLILMAFFPLILGLSEPEYHRASGLTTQPYLWRWLAVTGVLFAGSAVIYALRWRRASSRARKQVPGPHSRRPGPATSSRPPPPRTPSRHRPLPVPASTSGIQPAPPRARTPPARTVIHDHGQFLTHGAPF